MALETIALVSLVASTGVAAQQRQQQKKAERGVKRQQRKQRTRQAGLLEEERAEAGRIRQRDVQRRRSRAIAAGQPRQRATILTGPTGIPGQQASGGKTLLGT